MGHAGVHLPAALSQRSLGLALGDLRASHLVAGGLLLGAAIALAVAGSMGAAPVLIWLVAPDAALEVAGRFPPGADLDAAWRVGLTALRSLTEPS